MTTELQQLANTLDGELFSDELMRRLYATDASVYRELPLAVAYPKSIEDVQRLVHFARANQTSLIPRAAGTSLAGQCVGTGVVVDVSRYFNSILELNAEERWVRVQPGVIRDELNAFLKPHGLFFGPNTSTANRCMLGGMVGNNSCGSTSIVYGSTRDRTLALRTVLSDGAEHVFEKENAQQFEAQMKVEGLLGQIYQNTYTALADAEVQSEIRRAYPRPEIHRRNTGYALDLLIDTTVFQSEGRPFNFCELLCGSEGTLAFTTEIKLALDPLPPPAGVVVAAHFSDLFESLRAVLVAMEQELYACELMDRIILECTKGNLEQQKNRFFVEGDPAAILLLEVRAETMDAARAKANALIDHLKSHQFGDTFPIIEGADMKKVWDLRKAGLGLLANIPGDPKAVACIEDTAVALPDLPAYIEEFAKLMERFGQEAVYYAHAGAGELHLRPILNLKKSQDVALFRQISEASARLVKKYGGSMSGEHGDGRVRAEFIPLVLGEKNYELLKRCKQIWDPQGIFNPGKIVDAPPMDESLRYIPDEPTREIDTVFDFSATGGILRAAEKCNGSGDCRKLSLSGGTMCPSYRATRAEKDTTRARANALREFLTQSAKDNVFDHPELKEVMDLCLSCKGCTSECPSNVDMATLKAEFLHQYYQTNGVPLRARLFSRIADLNSLAIRLPALSNFFLRQPLLKKLLGIAPQRQLPRLHTHSLRRWYQRHYSPPKQVLRTVYFFCDEFTNFNDVSIGIKAIQLLSHLGYDVQIPAHRESGRAAISKGMLRRAQQLANENVAELNPLINSEQPLLGLEPSAILTFRDEYPRLVREDLRGQAKELGEHCLLIDTFLSREIQAGRISAESFDKAPRRILLHGHCHQKALASVEHSAWMLCLPEQTTVEVMPTGCCGMAGSFGYEAEHYEVSQQVGELVLFPTVRRANAQTIIAAPGTSCRHQIADGTGRKALHPVEILYDALVTK